MNAAVKKILTIIPGKKVLKTVAYLLIFATIYLLAQLWTIRDKPYGKAPEIAGISLQGAPVFLHKSGGKPTLLYFWASWCPVCRLEHGAISDLAEDYQVLSIAMQSGTDDEVRNHMREEGARYPVINDPDGIIAMRYGIRGVPTSFILDARGNIRSKATGYTLEAVLRYRLWQLESE